MDYYQLLNISKKASRKDVEKAFRQLSLKWHPDRHKDPQVKKIVEDTYKGMTVAYDTLIDEVKRKKYDYSIGIYSNTKSGQSYENNIYSVYDSTDQNNPFSPFSCISQNKQFTLFFTDGYFLFQNESKKWMNGKVWLEERGIILWIKEIERPINAAVSNNGIVILIHTKYKDYTKSSSSKLQEFIDLGNTLTIIEKTGEQTFTYDFGSNIEGCDISVDGNLIAIATLAPDDSVYCFDLQHKRLLWKYKNHARKKVLKLQFIGNNIDIFTGISISTANKEYSLQLDGNLTPYYSKEREFIDSIKKQSAEQKCRSIIEMIDSGERQRILEGFSQLISFISTKNSFSYYNRIVEILVKYIQTKDEEVFNILWKVIRGMMRKQSQAITPLIPKILSRIKKNSHKDYTNILRYLGELGGVNPNWIINELPLIKQKMESKFWNERRSAVFAIGSIGSIDVNLVEEVIPMMIEYLANSEVPKRDHQVQIHKQISSYEIDSDIWLRDAYIDALGMIGKTFPESVRDALPLLENLANYSSSHYTIRKAKRALKAIQGI